ncbi:ShlB/FhaC/HecB family hemolysin secretion/activation protein [Chitinimonas viridis]|uniref:ShlB/FhaC/HecB family hemolysin secretion/activation protein n=1 Tax=Chitinimonas viridis TaxID=664880 RepID=A0ABT8B9Z2_9NEIS|nr:ShlB/FhaC/HecB family hemolysin secretion/activation protein [Chitinimonas viridis]MDN3578973.1 ShlB/FhaC/HecB family hemolysin secretion/activation protein [Chitinimonas viridis]
MNPRHLPSIVLLASIPALAADPVALPSPGSVERSLKRPEAAPRPPAEVLFRRDDGASEHDPKGRRFRVNGFDFRGNKVISEFRLKRVLERFLDRELNLYDLGRAADAVSEHYQQAGYPLARALVPAQRVTDGLVRIDVVEGVLGEVKVAGNSSYGAQFLLEFGGELPAGQAIAQAPLENKLLLLNDQPGLRARATLVPGKQYGSSDLLIQVEEKRFSFDAALTNGARKEIGQTRLDMTANFNNPLGYGDQLSLRAILSERDLLKYGKLSYSLPIGDQGARLSLNHSRVNYDVGGALAPLALQGEVETSELLYSYPLLRSRERDRSLGLGYNYRELQQNALGVTVSRKYLALASLTWRERWFDQDGTAWNWRLTASSNGRRYEPADPGITIPPVNPNDPPLVIVPPKPGQQNAERLRLEAYADATAALSKQWDVFVKAQWVYSRNTLPDSDKFDIGGPDSVRAYRPSEMRGDSGEALTLEARRQIALFGRAAQASVFADYGRVIYKQRGFRNGSDELGAVGVGLTVYPTSNSTVKVEYAHAAMNNYRADDGKQGRLWFNLSASF